MSSATPPAASTSNSAAAVPAPAGAAAGLFRGAPRGDSVARVRELENIRSFLTGQALTLLLDLLFSVVFVAIMFAYSVPLTLIVLVTLPLYVGMSLAVVPLLRARLDEKFARGAENQALLVETVIGIQTVKAARSSRRCAPWDNQLAAYVSAELPHAARWPARPRRRRADWQAGRRGHLVLRRAAGDRQRVERRPVHRLQHVRAASGAADHAPRATVAGFPAGGISVQRLGDILNTRTEVPPAAAARCRRSRAHHVRRRDVSLSARSRAGAARA